LRAEKTDRGLRLVVPYDTLFEPTGKTLRGDTDQKLQDIAALPSRNTKSHGSRSTEVMGPWIAI